MAENTVLLKALTPEAKAALGGIYYRIAKFPFRVGRESRTTMINEFIESRRKADSVPNNDLHIVETSAPLNVSGSADDNDVLHWNIQAVVSRKWLLRDISIRPRILFRQG